jgi:transmembrane sensor
MDSEQLARFLAGEATANERQKVEAWASSEPKTASELALLQRVWTARPAPGGWDVDAAWDRLAERLDRSERPRPTVIPITRNRRSWIWVAAAAVVILAAGLFYSISVPTGVYRTAAGERRELTLADGSSVVLAPDSHLTISTEFGRGAREVSLVGRAWFDIRHDLKHPFRVQTTGALIEDLGTEFEVVARPGTAPIRVAVLAGSVAVQSRAEPPDARVTLGPRDVARIPSTGPLDVDHEVSVEQLTGWRDGTLNFDDATLESVAAELSRWYGVEIVVTDSGVAALHLSAPIPTANLDEALAIVKAALPIDVQRSAARITLVAKGSP